MARSDDYGRGSSSSSMRRDPSGHGSGSYRDRSPPRSSRSDAADYYRDSRSSRDAGYSRARSPPRDSYYDRRESGHGCKCHASLKETSTDLAALSLTRFVLFPPPSLVIFVLSGSMLTSRASRVHSWFGPQRQLRRRQVLRAPSPTLAELVSPALPVAVRPRPSSAPTFAISPLAPTRRAFVVVLCISPVVRTPFGWLRPRPGLVPLLA